MNESSIIIRRYEFVDRSSFRSHRRSQTGGPLGIEYIPYSSTVFTVHPARPILYQISHGNVSYPILNIYSTPRENARTLQSTRSNELERGQQVRSEQAKTGDQPLKTEIFAQLVTNYHSGTVLLV